MRKTLFSTICISFVLAAALLACSQTTHSVSLSWTEVTTGVTFNVYRAAASTCSSVVLVNLSPVTVTNYVDTNVTGGGTYSYYVTAVGTGGESAPSNCVTVQIPNPPQAPQTLTVTAK